MSRERADILNAKKVLADVWPGQAQENSVALLKALHILTRDGALNHDPGASSSRSSIWCSFCARRSTPCSPKIRTR